ncbi:MAG TPA: DUF6316 family protein [Marinobacter sp.]|nr:DUF6316 family protein [Marinobacter sp.]
MTDTASILTITEAQGKNVTLNFVKKAREVSMNTQRRTGEQGPAPFRSSRFFCVGNKWYFTTREGFDSGPFATRERAEIGLKRFLHVVRLLPDEQALH